MEFPLKSKKFVSIGKLPLSDYELRSLARDQQGRLMTGISKKLDFIILGEKPTAKQLEKAKASGAPLIGYAEFEGMLNREFMKFTVEGLNGAQPPAELLSALSGKNWALWRQIDTRKLQSEPLIELLKTHEQSHGVTKVHHYCSQQLRDQFQLDLRHPFHHTSPIRNHDVSPNGKYLATSSDLNEEYEKRKSILQIWDLELAQPVNQISMQGGIGSQRSDEILNGIQWSPDSQLIGLNKNLNGIAVYKPNGARLSEAYITNGIPNAIMFDWATNSEWVAIHWPYYEKLGVSEDTDVEEKVTWMPAEVEPPRGTNHRDSEKHCVPGRETDHPLAANKRAKSQLPPVLKGKHAHAKGNAYYQTANRIVAVGPDSIHFFDAQGELIREFRQYNWNPISSQSKTQRMYSSSPLFPLNQDRSQFGKLVQDGLAVPEGYDYSEIVFASLGRQCAWPLNWIKGIPLYGIDAEDW